MPLEQFSTQAPEMRPETFFAGRTSGNGVLQTGKGQPARQIQVESNGTMQPDGNFRLDQTIRDSRGKTSTRFWLMRRTGPNQYAATLSDAAGPVRGEVHGNLFHLKYLAKKPMVTMEQWLYLQPDGRTVMNEAIIRMPGRTIARLSETITKGE